MSKLIKIFGMLILTNIVVVTIWGIGTLSKLVYYASMSILLKCSLLFMFGSFILILIVAGYLFVQFMFEK